VNAVVFLLQENGYLLELVGVGDVFYLQHASI
jgi:hypothetical protein